MKEGLRMKYFNQAAHVKVVLTHNCNLGCPYCVDNPSKGRDEQFPYEDDFLAWASSLPSLKSVLLFGGEPLMSTRWLPFAEKLLGSLPDVRVGLFSNGTMLPAELSKFLTNERTFIFVTRTPWKDEHDADRFYRWSNAGSFDIVTSNLEKLHAVCGDRLTLTTTMKASNLYRAADAIIQDFSLADRIKFNLIKHDFTQADYDALLECLCKIADYLTDNPDKCMVNFAPYPAADRVRLATDYNRFRQGALPYDHLSGIKNLLVDLDGKIYPTFPIEVGKHYMGDIFGNVHPENYDMYTNVKENGQCDQCDLKYTCSPCYDYVNKGSDPLPFKKESYCGYTRIWHQAMGYFFSKAKEKGLI